MFNRVSTRLSVRLFVVPLLIVAITTVSASAGWTDYINPFAYTATANESTAIEPISKSTGATLITAGTCDLGNNPLLPMEVESSGGSLAGTPTGYATLRDAFVAINGGLLHTGVITIDVCENSDELAATASIAGGNDAGPADYTSITISPAGGAARTITGATTAGNSTILLSGADNVTIDGLNTGGNTLTIQNTTVSTTASTSTIRFVDDASSNVIRNTTLLGAGTGTSTGTIFLSTTGITTGNDDNVINANNIGPVGATFPTNAILSSGTTTNQTTRNSGIQITNNRVYDFYNSGGTVANGILASGSTDFTITGNSFYQTASRAMAASGGFIGVSISDTSSVNNTVSNNFVGGSAVSAGGTAWTQTGAVSHTFIGIRMSVGTAIASSLQNNTVSNLNITTSTASTVNAGISAVTGAMNIGTVTGNTIGATTGTGNITWTGAGAAARFAGISAGTGTPGGINISNNNIGSITIAGAGTTTFYGIRMEGAATAAYTVASNTIGSTATSNSITHGTNSIFAAVSSTHTGVAASVTGNTIQNLQHTSTGTTASLRGIELTGSVSGQNIANNIIRNLSSASTNTGSTTSTAVGGIVLTGSATSGNTITANTIRDLASTTSGATAVYANGITITSTPGTTMSRNFIFNLTTASTSATSSIQGIYLFNSSATENIYNNMIRLGTGVGNNPIIRGIRDNTATGSPTNIVHNSIFIDGTQGAATVNTNCIVRDLASTMTIRNNILWNNRASTGAPGAQLGRHYGIQNTSATGTFVSNNNDIYTPNNGGAIGQSSALDRITLGNWQSATSQDLNSFNLDPQFVDATNATTPDLHIHPTNVTIIEGNGGVVATPTDDFDGQTRSGLTPVDIGADAGNFVGIDLAGPTITYTPFSNTSSTGDRMLVTTITDNSGVPTIGVGLPVIYYRKNAGAWASTQCSYISGNSYDCSIIAAAVGGVAIADAIQYYVVAQDTVGNVSANPAAGAGGFSINPPTASTPPTTPNQYIIVGPASGSYNVGIGETYTSLTNTGGIFEFINNSEVTGNITLNITTDLAGELGTVALNEFASPYTILIKPSGGPRIVTGSSATAIIRLNGADRVRIDGSTAASFAENVVGGTPALRELTIENTNTGTASGVVLIGTGTNGAQNNTLRNLNVDGNAPTTTLLGISLGGNTVGAAGADNDSNRVENCRVRRAAFGIYSAGASIANPNTGTIISENQLDATLADRIGRVGIIIFNDNGALISENSVGGITSSSSADSVGIGLGVGAVDAQFSNVAATSGGVTNALVDRNRINGVQNDNTWGAAGIAVAGDTAGANTISNNMITGVISDSTSPDIVAGIFVAGVTGSNTILYHNSVSMTGDRSALTTPGTSQLPSYGIAITGVDPTVEMKNNIFYTTQTAEAVANPGALSYAIGMVSTTFTNLDSDSNDFWSAGPRDGGFRTGSLASAAGTSHVDLSAWQVAITNDATSQEADPVFINPANDLHLDALTTPLLGDGQGGETFDHDGDPRPAANTDVGADEVVQSVGGSFPAGTYYNGATADGDVLSGNVTFTNALTLNGILTTIVPDPPNSDIVYVVTLGCGVTSVGNASTSNYIVGSVNKQYCGPANFTYPVGSGGFYSPANVDVTAVGVNPSSLTVRPHDALLVGFNPLETLTRNWQLDEVGDITANLLFYYDESDVVGNESDYRIWRRESNGTDTNMCSGGPCVDTVNNILGPVNGVTTFSRWTGSGPLAPTSSAASVSGRVVTANGQGIRGAAIVITGNSLPTPIIVKTGSLGYFQADNLDTGQTYVVTVVSKRFTFSQPSRVINLADNINDVDFMANPLE